MKNVLKVVALVFVLGFVSCTDDELIPENGKTEIQAGEIGKGDSTTSESGGADNPTMDED